MHAGHHIVRCRYCDKLMEQCRCMSKDKPVRYDTCELCSATHGRAPSSDSNAAPPSENKG